MKPMTIVEWAVSGDIVYYLVFTDIAESSNLGQGMDLSLKIEVGLLLKNLIAVKITAKCTVKFLALLIRLITKFWQIAVTLKTKYAGSHVSSILQLYSGFSLRFLQTFQNKNYCKFNCVCDILID